MKSVKEELHKKILLQVYLRALILYYLKTGSKTWDQLIASEKLKEYSPVHVGTAYRALAAEGWITILPNGISYLNKEVFAHFD